jgi:hypothetical protein
MVLRSGLQDGIFDQVFKQCKGVSETYGQGSEFCYYAAAAVAKYHRGIESFGIMTCPLLKVFRWTVLLP